MAMEPKEAATGQLGIERWVQFAFIAVALVAFWLFDNMFARTAEFVAQKANVPTPNATLVTAGAAIAAIILAAVLYKHREVGKFSREVARELSQVTWPTKKETYAQTVVVLIVSFIAAVILGVFDAAWSAVTDLIYH